MFFLQNTMSGTQEVKIIGDDNNTVHAPIILSKSVRMYYLIITSNLFNNYFIYK